MLPRFWIHYVNQRQVKSVRSNVTYFLRARKDCPLCVPPGDLNNFTIFLRKLFPWKMMPSVSWPFIGCCQPGATLCFQLFLKATSLAFNPLKARRGEEGWVNGGGGGGGLGGWMDAERARRREGENPCTFAPLYLLVSGVLWHPATKAKPRRYTWWLEKWEYPQLALLQTATIQEALMPLMSTWEQLLVARAMLNDRERHRGFLGLRCIHPDASPSQKHVVNFRICGVLRKYQTPYWIHKILYKLRCFWLEAVDNPSQTGLKRNKSFHVVEKSRGRVDT